MEDNASKNKRIAKNTILLYIRTFIVLIITLYTSRIVLKSLGVDNYGVYNVIGGLIGMISIVSSPIQTSIMRYITFGLGKGDVPYMRKVFSTSINILLSLGAIILLIGETAGLWFLNCKMNIPEGSMIAANWTLQCSLLTFIIGLVNMPFSAAIVAHEKMGVFAYFSIFDVVMKLGLAFYLLATPFNSLIIYSIGVLVIVILQQILYGIYCGRKFTECHYEFCFDRRMTSELTKFAGWQFLGNSATLINFQGVSILMNLFFGVVANTAKGIAGQVEAGVMSFVNSFTTSFTPQIIKSYASGDIDYMFSIMIRGTKFSLYLLLLFLIPLEYEAETVIRLWLGNIPPYSAIFLKLSLINTAVLMLGSPFLQGISATGNIRNYQIAASIIAILVFPLTWGAYKLGLPVESFYPIFFIMYGVLVWIRMTFVKKLLGFPLHLFWSKVFLPIVLSSIVSAIMPALIYFYMPESFLRLVTLTIVSVVWTCLTVYLLGMDKSERNVVQKGMTKILSKISLHKKTESSI